MVLARNATPTLFALRKRSDSGLSQAQMITGGRVFMLAARGELGRFELGSFDRSPNMLIAVKARRSNTENLVEIGSLIRMIYLKL
jgi:hypothetical protein